MKRMIKKPLSILLSLLMVFSVCGTLTLEAVAWATNVTDHLTSADFVATNNNYKDFSGVEGESGAVYAGQTAADGGSIQMRSNNNNSGIVSTTSGGKITRVTIVWHSKTPSNQSGKRELQVYGSNTAYTAATDLYDTNKSGTLLGSIKFEADYETVLSLNISDDYEYVGVRSKNGAIYLQYIEFTWANSGPDQPCQHVWGDELIVDTEPTCGEVGSGHYVCTLCGESSDPVEIQPTGEHVWGEELFPDQEATCGEPGSGHYVCTVCGAESEPVEIPATGEHAWSEELFPDQEATCGEPGSGHYVCTVCGADSDPVEIEPTGNHTWGTELIVVKAPTCGEYGYGFYRCTVCNADSDRVDIAPTGNHTWADEITVDQAPTCGEPGSGHYVCTVCGAESDPEEIPATGEHTYDDQDWEYFDEDQHVHYCTVCGEPEYEDHDVIVKGAGGPTCGDEGYTGDEYCSICGAHLSEGEIIQPTGEHVWGEELTVDVEPTCGEPGSGHYVCTVCGAESDPEVIVASGEHTYDDQDWEYYDENRHVHYCTVCGEPEYEDHDVIVKGAGGPTCVDEGYTGDEFCSVCGAHLSEGEIIQPTGEHVWGDELIVDQEPTATEAGSGHFVCTVCGAESDPVELEPTGEEPDEPAEAGPCGICGEVHDPKTMSGWWTGLLHDILFIIKRIAFWWI